MSFPLFPNDGDTYTSLAGIGYRFSSATSSWDIITQSLGVTGLQGYTGLQGATGLQGPQGDTGIQGFQGVTGLQGIQGDTGIQGVQGETGIQGTTGVRGIDGVTGVQGVTGIQAAINGLEMTGITTVTGMTFIDYPDLWNKHNTYVLAMKIQSGNEWRPVDNSKIILR